MEGFTSCVLFPVCLVLGGGWQSDEVAYFCWESRTGSSRLHLPRPAAPVDSGAPPSRPSWGGMSSTGQSRRLQKGLPWGVALCFL